MEGRLVELDGKAKTGQDQIEKEIKEVKNDLDEVKVMMIQVLEKLNMLEQHNKVSSPTAEILNTPREDILVAAGTGVAAKTTEIYSWEKNC